MNTLVIEPKASRMLSGYDTTNPCASHAASWVSDLNTYEKHKFRNHLRNSSAPGKVADQTPMMDPQGTRSLSRLAGSPLPADWNLPIG